MKALGTIALLAALLLPSSASAVVWCQTGWAVTSCKDGQQNCCRPINMVDCGNGKYARQLNDCSNRQPVKQAESDRKCIVGGIQYPGPAPCERAGDDVYSATVAKCQDRRNAGCDSAGDLARSNHIRACRTYCYWQN